MSIPNLITLGRILLVPIVVWAITSGGMRIAFFLFLAAGISDGVDGFLAKRFHMKSELGAYQRFYEGMVRCLRDGKPPPVDPEDAVKGLEIIEAARRSAAEHRIITLD